MHKNTVIFDSKHHVCVLQFHIMFRKQVFTVIYAIDITSCTDNWRDTH